MDTNRHHRTKIVAGVAGAIVLAVAVGATGAVAASRALSADDESQAIIDDAADQLGVEPSALADALKQALENRVDRAVESGRLTEEQGNRLKERIDHGSVPFLGGFGHKGFGWGHGPHGFGGLDAATSYLGITEDELRSELAAGATLADLAEAEGRSVEGLVDAMVADAETRIDQAVADGKLTDEQAATAKERLREHVTALVNGELRPRGLGRGGERSPGFRGGSFHDAPWGAERPGA
jgi:polyhydroxyalkanoate synthesis regulator phasin